MNVGLSDMKIHALSWYIAFQSFPQTEECVLNTGTPSSYRLYYSFANHLTLLFILAACCTVPHTGHALSE